MTCIRAQNITIYYPLFGSSSRSLKKTLVRAATGGRIANDARGISVCAIDNLTFSFSEGERIGLVGHNGAGKTTLLRALAGVYKPAGGLLAVEGKIASLLDISMGMDDEFTGYENIYIRSILAGIAKSDVKNISTILLNFPNWGTISTCPCVPIRQECLCDWRSPSVPPIPPILF